MKRFGLLMLVAVLWSGLSIGTFNVQAAKSVLSENTNLVSATPKTGTLLSFNQPEEIDFSDYSDVKEVVSNNKGCLISIQMEVYNTYHQRFYLNSFLSYFDNDPFSRIYRSSV